MLIHISIYIYSKSSLFFVKVEQPKKKKANAMNTYEENLKAEFDKFKTGKIEVTEGKTDTILPFTQVKAVDIENYVSYIAGSDENYNDTFVKKSALILTIVFAFSKL